MAYTITHFAPETRGRIDAFFNRFGQGMNAYLESRARCAEIEALEAKTDAELAGMGLTRDRIPAHVFRDTYWL
ncbi:hypothetical protein GIY56_09970 [Paracoccus sp. YIM 132242]|uniref:DUF1127 domain-containing protein n=1 Tax=Paracoccus lichenicola TaxID=2665644 RepID=A0A6L6HN81_9RHOB|nr:hypothetical protein [Paracoccus lichenicola]MTE00614.1 hypothetical protein [Paracoccus lichenicola]